MRSQLLRMLKYRIGFCQLNRDAPMPPSGMQIPPTQVQPPLPYTQKKNLYMLSCRFIANQMPGPPWEVQVVYDPF